MKNGTEEFKPFVPADKIMPEFTVTSLLIGVLLAIVFGAANAYLGLRVGMTVSASIPAAVISMGIIRMVLRRDSILENNMVQTIGSAGESVAAGAIFTLPALFIWANEWGTSAPSLLTIFLIALVGGLLGVLFMVPLRKALIVEEHGTLPYPEGTACAEVLLAGEEGGAKASTVFAGLGVAAVYKFVADGLGIFPSSVQYDFKGYKGAAIGIDVLPALVGVGYICGPKISSYMLSGGVVSWLVLMPLISLFGADNVIFPGTVPISEMTPSVLWSTYIKYIGAGAVAAGGIISLVKTFPLIIRTFVNAMGSLGGKQNAGAQELRTGRDLPMPFILISILVIAFAIWLLPAFPVNLFGAIMIVIFGFFFATVSARLVGMIGSSNNPVSGMSIATLLLSTMLLKVTGTSGQAGMTGAIAIGSIICIVAAIAGDTSQDLKTGYILGATPKWQQYGEFIGTLVSAAAIGGVLYLLNAAWGFGSDQLPAPQATMMQLVVQGVMEANLPWTFVFAGAGIAIMAEILGIPVLPFAVGLYLPFQLSAGIMAGGLVRLWLMKRKHESKEAKDLAVEHGTLYTSGLIAGEGLIGILLAVFAVVNVGGKDIASHIYLGDKFSLGGIGGLILFLVLLGTLIFATMKKEKQSDR